MTWQPTASIQNLQRRATALKEIRAFFALRDVMEVETPALSRYGVSDVHLRNFETEFVGPGYAKGISLYLQTSPEYAMKRLLAAGSGSIYQMSRAFRNEESGRFHNPEFTMLEWYRVGFDAPKLIQEVDELVQSILNCPPAEVMTYQQACLQFLGLDPLEAPLSTLKAKLTELGWPDVAEQEDDRDILLQCLFSEGVELQIGQDKPTVIYQFPASQAALAKISSQDSRVAERFELYYKGVELANGFDELTSAEEQRQRFEQDNRKRESMGILPMPIDEDFLAALEAGLPDCAGVALGVDRLLMLAIEAEQIEEVIAFPTSRA
ncbi:elongation factor P--(R)-beta-lysine ligase [Algicola sagamiensis]|uniref:elongation factor P--(R)-beta-lysine ligase n=1 Tax=Algicola sagamiensis TaxID=163869 RepID=UPI00036737B1|nr:elongation factor P--(R)-beta-lysine ligase [Algicola sagamiensis]